MEIQGKIIKILPLQSGVGKASGKEWRKQEYILETLDAQFPRKICFNLWGDNIERTALQLGEDVTVQIEIESREFNERWYTDVRGYRVDRGFVTLQPTAIGPAPQAGIPSPYGANSSSPRPGSLDAGPFGGKQPPTFDPSTAPLPPSADDLPF